MKYIIAITIILSAPLLAVGQSAPKPYITEGRDFMIVLPLEGDSIKYIRANGFDSLDIFLVSTKLDADVEITFSGSPFYKKQLQLPRDSFIMYTITDDIDPIVYGGNTPHQKTIRIRSSAPIRVYAFRKSGLGYEEMYHPIPIEQSGSSFIVPSYYTHARYRRLSDDTIFTSGRFFLASSLGETSVKVNLSSATTAGDDFRKELHFFLGAGECILFYTQKTTHFDLTGTQINTSSPVIVYGGHYGTRIPIPDWKSFSGRGSENVSVPSVEMYGQTFVVRKFPPREGSEYFYYARGNEGLSYTEDSLYDVVRVIASDDDTKVSINRSEWKLPLAKGEFRDTICAYPLLIEASKPVLVVQYMHGEYFHKGFDTIDVGTFMTLVPPLESAYHSYDFFLHPFDTIVPLEKMVKFDPTEMGFNHQAILIAIPKNARGKIAIDGTVMPDTGFIDLPPARDGSLYSIGAYKLRGGRHTVKSTTSPPSAFTAIAYGYGAWKSYGYAVGRGLSSLNIVSSDIKHNIDFVIEYQHGDQAVVVIPPIGCSNIEVVSVLGTVVHSVPISSQSGQSFTIPITSLPSGSYIVRIVNNHSIKVSKLINIIK